MLYIFKKLISIIFIILFIAVAVWVVVSYANILTHNLHTGYNYPSWNFFTVFIE